MSHKIISTITILYTILILYFLFLAFFFLSILLMEIIQALTLPGSFDVNDAIRNSLGAAVGFGAYKLGVRSKNGWRNIVMTAISCMALLLGGWGLCGIVDKAFTKEEGPFAAINEWKDGSGNSSTGNNTNSFRISGQNVKPRYNRYGVEGENAETFTYTFK